MASTTTFGQEQLTPRGQALEPPKVFINPDESQYSSTRRLFQGIPGIERTPNGRLWVSRFSGGKGEGSGENYAMLITSGDEDRTWSNLKVVIDSPDEPMIVQREDGTPWMLVRTYYGMGESVSRDLGKTWTPVHPAAIKHTVARFHIRRLRSGNLLLGKHGRCPGTARKILITVFTEADVLSGRPSKKTRLHVLVNRAIDP